MKKDHFYFFIIAVFFLSSCGSKKVPYNQRVVVKSFPTEISLFDENHSPKEDFNTVDTPPMPQNCDTQNPIGLRICYHEKAKAFINSNLKYPESATANNIEGTVSAKYIIDKNGLITNVSVKGNIHLVDESLRLIKAFPKVSPAIKNGKATSYEVNLPIVFELTRTNSEK